MADNARLTALLGVNLVLALGALTLGYINLSKTSELTPRVVIQKVPVVVTPTFAPTATPSAGVQKYVYPTTPLKK